MFEENANLALLYTYSNPDMGADFADGEIQTIYEKKRQYDQDEGYFTWLDLYAQPRWQELRGINQALIQDTKDADKTLRIILGRMKSQE